MYNSNIPPGITDENLPDGIGKFANVMNSEKV